jgi:hypothetical protein
MSKKIGIVAFLSSANKQKEEKIALFSFLKKIILHNYLKYLFIVNHDRFELSLFLSST